MRGPVVVEVDGTSSSLAAVEVAAWEADRLGVDLRLTHAFTWPAGHVPPGVPPWDSEGAGLRDRVNGTFAAAEQRARRVAPHVTITRDVLVGEPVTVLESESRSASLTVLGARRAHGSGSVADRLAAHSRGPVLVLRGEPDHGGPVVLVDDCSPQARTTAEFAFAEASEHGTDLVVLRTRRVPVRWSLTELSKRYPAVGVRHRRIRSRRALVEASAAARLVVVGTRHRMLGLSSGAVGRTALRHARCPVAVVPEAKP